MIYNYNPNQKNDFQMMITDFNNSEFLFYLTGSRYFGTAQPESDYDFFVQYDTKVCEFLAHRGFSSKYNSPTHYRDSELVAVVHNNGLNIDVQMVKDAVLKNSIQEMISKRQDMLLMLSKQLPKIYHSAFWDLMYCQAKFIIPGTDREPGRLVKDINLHREVYLHQEAEEILHLLQSLACVPLSNDS